MRDLAQKASCRLPFQILAGQFATWQFIDPWIRARYRYVDDPMDLELVRTPELMLDTLMGPQGFFCGDCDDVATFSAALFRAAGYRVRFVAIRTDPCEPEFLHVYIEVHIEMQWLTFDPTVRPGTLLEAIERMEMAV
jgi:transglutaminase-like putative cysteine protease